MSSGWTLGLWLAVALVVVAARPADGEAPPESDEPSVLTEQEAEAGDSGQASVDSGRRFSLDLATTDLGSRQSFTLFASADAGRAAGARLLPDREVSSSSEGPARGGLHDLSAELAWSLGEDRVPDGLRIHLGTRTWDDLDTWEKTGLVLSRASAAAGLGYLLYRLFD